jgi:zinc resistance-associated protein
MRKGKLLLALALVMSLSLATAAWARPWGWGHWAANLTPEQAGQLFDLRQKFLDETAGLRKQMVVKRAELRALWQADTPDEKAIVAKQKEISALRDQLQPKVVAFRLQAKKLVPKGALGPRAECPMGMGPGMGGPGPGMGPHFMGPGMGMDPVMDMALGPGDMGPGCPW